MAWASIEELASGNADEIPNPEEFIEELNGAQVSDLIQIVASVDPLDPQYASEHRDLILACRQVWKATGL